MLWELPPVDLKLKLHYTCESMYNFVGQAAQHGVDIKRVNYWTHKSGISTPGDLLCLGYEIALSATDQHVNDEHSVKIKLF